MAIAHSAGEFPRSLALIAAACGLFVGFFSFIFSCVLEDRAPASGYYTIMLSIVLCACALIILLAALNIFKIFQVNVHLTASIVVFGIVISFIQLVGYSRMARVFNISSPSKIAEAYFAVCIVLVLLLLGVMVVYAVFFVILMKHVCTTTTCVTSTTRTTTTTIETPPSYMNETSQVPK